MTSAVKCGAIKRLESLQVRDVMSPRMVEFFWQEPMAAAAKRFVEYEINAAPVVDETGCCVGMLSTVDVLRREAGTAEGDSNGDLVRDHMTKVVHSVRQNTPLLAAAQTIDSQHVHRLPVLDGSARPIAVVSSTDIVAALLNAIEEMESQSSDAASP